MTKKGIVLCLLFFMALGLALAGALIQAWPLPAGATASSSGATLSAGCNGSTLPSPSPSPTAAMTTAASPSRAPSPSPVAPSPVAQPFAPTCLYGFLSLPTSPDGRLLSLVALTGAIGATIFALRSFVIFTGNRTLIRSWLPLYFAAPVIGALLGQLFYVILRAGLLSPSASTADVSPYGFAAVAALGGLYSAQALEKLKSVFEVMFAKVTDHNDPLVTALTITDVNPTHGRIGSPVTVTGTGLSRVNRLFFTDNVPAALGAQTTDVTLTVTVPVGATSGPIIFIDTAGTRAMSPRDFTVDP